jgi:hypothetical protein
MKSLLLPLFLLALSTASAQTFHKTKMIDAKGKEQEVSLNLDKDKQVLEIRAIGRIIEQVPNANIDKVSYELSAHHRVKQGAVLMFFSLGAGGILMLTKEKYHWLYVDVKPPVAGGETKTITVKLDKSEYKQALDAISQQTGKQVETLKE